MFDEIRKVVEKNYYKLQKEAEQKEQARNRLFAAYGLDKADERNNSVRDDLMNAIKKLSLISRAEAAEVPFIENGDSKMACNPNNKEPVRIDNYSDILNNDKCAPYLPDSLDPKNEELYHKSWYMLDRFEGYSKTPYLDTVGKITADHGHNINDKNTFYNYYWRNRTTELPATPKEIDDCYKKLQKYKAEGKYGLSWPAPRYARVCRIEVQPDKTDKIFGDRIAYDIRTLNNRNPNFCEMPLGYQLGGVDIEYNNGRMHTGKKGFPLLIGFMKEGDSENAAKQSHRKQVQKERNQMVHDLFRYSTYHPK